MGVDLFFVLSGYLITGVLLIQPEVSSLGGYIGRFYERRAKRILPAYVMSLLVTVAIFGAAWLARWYLYLGAMNFIQPLKIDSPITLQPLWSLAVEEQFYLVWPFAVYYLSRKNLIRLSLAVLIVAPALRYFCTPLFPTPWAVYMLLPFRMDCLGAGALFALIQDRLAPARKWHAWLGALPIAAAAGYLVLLGRQGFSKGGNEPYGNFAIYESTLLISVFVFWMAWAGVAKSFLSSRVLVWLGTISLSLYLIHFTCLYVLPKSVPLAALLALIYASVMWLVIERPILDGFWRAKERLQPTEATHAAAD
jgi:peptidoglycan/LPS O-acetylase OafA/YrhL